jgi:hypothetical protein
MSSDLPTGSITAAAVFSLVSFLGLLIGVPLMLNDVAQLENEMIQQRQIYMDMVGISLYFISAKTYSPTIKESLSSPICNSQSNRMWRDVMADGEQTRKERAAVAIRRRRQCEICINA